MYSVYKSCFRAPIIFSFGKFKSNLETGKTYFNYIQASENVRRILQYLLYIYTWIDHLNILKHSKLGIFLYTQKLPYWFASDLLYYTFRYNISNVLIQLKC